MTGRAVRETTIALAIALTVAAAPAFGDDYRLGISDRLKIKVQEWPDLKYFLDRPQQRTVRVALAVTVALAFRERRKDD